MSITLKKITKETFLNFGKVIGKPKTKPRVRKGPTSYWHDILEDKFDDGVVMSYLQVKKQSYDVEALEKHKNSSVCFIPLKGTAIMFFAPSLQSSHSKKLEPDLNKIVGFIIDDKNAFIVNKNVWYTTALPIGDEVEFLCLVPDDIISDTEFINIKELNLNTFRLI